MLRFLFTFTVLGFLSVMSLYAQEPSRSFELRYMTDDAKANGETDFKGETQYFDTEQRIDFLKQYARIASCFFNDTAYNTKVVSEAEVNAALQKIKPQPSPTVRRRIPLDEWRYLGYREGQAAEDTLRMQRWQQEKGVSLDSGHLCVTAPEKRLSFSFSPQSWRFSLRWRVKVPATHQLTSFALTDEAGNAAATLGFSSNGQFFYRTANGEEVSAMSYQPGRWYDLKIFVFAQKSVCSHLRTGPTGD